MAHYTKIEPITQSGTLVFEDLYLSSETISKRNQLKSLMDEFCNFEWRGINAFDVFGAFIINNRNLKFYNGPTYTNQYTKPQFESASGTLTGVSFNVQQISFSIGVYWISEDHYRRLIYWLHPYEINTLRFGFDKKYYYQVKLAKIDNGTRYIVGYENNEPMYYTEIQLTFEVQGPNCAYYVNKYELESTQETLEGNTYLTWKIINNWTDYPKQSDLSMPIKWYLHIVPGNIKEIKGTDLVVHLTGSALYNNSDNVTLFDIDLKNLVFNNISKESAGFNIIYDSENSLLFLNHGDSQNFLLSHLLTSSTGKRIVNQMTSQQYSIAGRFEDYEIDLTKVQFKLEVNCYYLDNNQKQINIPNSIDIIDTTESYIEMRARTNLI